MNLIKCFSNGHLHRGAVVDIIDDDMHMMLLERICDSNVYYSLPQDKRREIVNKIMDNEVKTTIIILL